MACELTKLYEFLQGAFTKTPDNVISLHGLIRSTVGLITFDDPKSAIIKLKTPTNKIIYECFLKRTIVLTIRYIYNGAQKYLFLKFSKV